MESGWREWNSVFNVSRPVVVEGSEGWAQEAPALEKIREARSGRMTAMEILTVSVVFGGLIFLGIISFTLTAGVLREYLLADGLHTECAGEVRPDHIPQQEDKPQIR